MEAQFNDARQSLNQQAEVNLHSAHGEVGVQGLQAFPHNPVTIEPERGLAQACFYLDQQIGVLPLGETIFIGLELVGSQPAQRGNVLRVALRHGIDSHPHQRSIEAQRPHIRGFVFEPPAAQRTRTVLLATQGFLRVFFVIDGSARREQLVGGLLDLSDHSPDDARFGLIIGSALDHVGQSPVNGQQQRCGIIQVPGQHRVQRLQLFDQTAKERQLLFDRHIVF